MWFTPSSTARRSTLIATSRSGFAVIRIEPKPIRLTVRSPRSQVPAAAAVTSSLATRRPYYAALRGDGDGERAVGRTAEVVGTAAVERDRGALPGEAARAGDVRADGLDQQDLGQDLALRVRREGLALPGVVAVAGLAQAVSGTATGVPAAHGDLLDPLGIVGQQGDPEVVALLAGHRTAADDVGRRAVRPVLHVPLEGRRGGVGGRLRYRLAGARAQQHGHGQQAQH